jgi:hypothetical protein
MTQSDHLENDLYQAAFLLARGISLNGLEQVGTRIVFAFDNADGRAVEALTEYARGAEVPAREYAAAIAQMKTRLYTAKFGSNGTRKESNRNDYAPHNR